MKTRSQRRSGFTLLEVVISLAILACCVIPIVAFIPEALTCNENALNETAATSVLSTVVSDLRSATLTTTGSTVTISASPLYKFLIPLAGGTSSISSTSAPQQVYVDSSGAVLNGNGPTAAFCISVGFSPPTGSGRTATGARIMISWPPQEANSANAWPAKYYGSIESTIYLDLN